MAGCGAGTRDKESKTIESACDRHILFLFPSFPPLSEFSLLCDRCVMSFQSFRKKEKKAVSHFQGALAAV